MSSDQPTAKKPAAKKPVAKKPAAKRPAAKTPARTKPAAAAKPRARRATTKTPSAAAAKPAVKAITTATGEVVTARQRTELISGLRAGADLDLSAAAAGIQDVEGLFAADEEIKRKARQEAARAEVRLLRKVGKTRPAFVLERTRPEHYAASRHRELPGEDDADDLDALAHGG